MWYVQLVTVLVAAYFGIKAARNKEVGEPPDADDVQAPTADSTQVLRAVFGTVEIDAPYVVYSGPVTIEPIKKKVSSK